MRNASVKLLCKVRRLLSPTRRRQEVEISSLGRVLGWEIQYSLNIRLAMYIYQQLTFDMLPCKYRDTAVAQLQS